MARQTCTLSALMSPRPLSVTILSCLFIAAGAFGVAQHAMRINPKHLFAYDGVWIVLVSLVAIVAGVFMLCGKNWARWLIMLWVLFHVIVSVYHPIQQLVVHILLLTITVYFLWRRPATAFFREKADFRASA
jgi:hypothetical protein